LTLFLQRGAFYSVARLENAPLAIGGESWLAGLHRR